MTQKDVKRIVCPLCGSNKQKNIREDNKLIIVKCSCGLYFVNPQPTKKYCLRFYNESFYYNPHNKENITRENKNDVVHQKVYSIVTNSKKKGSILDIGCGPGELLNYFDKKKYSLSGTEYSDVEISKAKKITQDIYKEDYLEINFKKKFDAIIMIDVLEHTQKPLKYLEKIHSDLNKNGLVVINVPNNDWTLMRGYKNNLVTNLHLFYFNKKTITDSLKKVGFKDITFYMNFRVNYYENWYKTLVIQLNHIISYILFKTTGLYKASGIIVSAKK